MEIPKKQKVLMILIVISLIIGGVMTAGSKANSKETKEWHKVIFQKDPAFSFYVPNVPRHTVAEMPFDKQKLKTASVISDEEGREYVVNITVLPTDLQNLDNKKIFKSVLDLLMPNEDSVLTYYEISQEIADFKIAMKNGGEIKQGKMTIKNGYLFLQMVTYLENNFSEDAYDKFIESLQL